MKTKIFFSSFFFLTTFFTSAQNRVTIAGTKCSMIPPTKFVTATAFSGFQYEDIGASIMVNELPAPFSAVSPGFTAQALQSKGMTMLKKDTIDFNGGKAFYIQLSQPANGTTYLKQLLVFGDDKKTVMVNGIYPQESKGITAEVKKAMLTILYNETQPEDGLNAAPFTIDVTGTVFKFTKYIAGSLLYTTDGKIPTDGATFIVSNSISKVDIKDKKIFCTDRLKQLPRGDASVIQTINPVTINSLTGYEIIAEGKGKNGEPELVYQVILFEKENYYLIVGLTKDDFAKNKSIFKSIAQTFKLK